MKYAIMLALANAILIGWVIDKVKDIEEKQTKMIQALNEAGVSVGQLIDMSIEPKKQYRINVIPFDTPMLHEEYNMALATPPDKIRGPIAFNDSLGRLVEIMEQ